ncbi:hypothetical protein [Streptomyces mayteni]
MDHTPPANAGRCPHTQGHGDAWLGDAEYVERRAELWTAALLD